MSVSARQDALDRAAESPFLTSCLRRFPDLATRFEERGSEETVRGAIASDPARAVRSDLRVRRARLATAVGLADLSGEWPLERVVGALSDFADLACERALLEAVRIAVPGWDERKVPGFCVLALGKHGGRELNYSSDIDPILLYDPVRVPRRQRDDPGQAAERIARAWVDLLQSRDGDGYVFRVDLRLRPAPEASPPAVPVDGAVAHYEAAALPWERAAMVRARVAAGDRELGHRFLSDIRPFVWRRSLDFGAAAELSDMAARIRASAGGNDTAAPGGDLKRGRGGIREVEFFVQALQLIHGGRDESLREPNLLLALERLVVSGRLESDRASGLAASYRRLRTVEHRLQMMDDRQTHSLPVDLPALDAVARLDGCADGAALLADLRPVVETVAARFAELDVRPKSGLPFEESDLRRHLREDGFTDAAAAARQVTAWRSATMPALRSGAAQAALEHVLPLLVSRLGEAGDPRTALHRFDDMLRRLPSAIGLLRLLQANPEVARVLADVMAAAPALADMLAERPQLLDRLLDASAFDAPETAHDLVDRWQGRILSLPLERALDALRDRVNEERFALGVQAVLASRTPRVLSRGYASVAEAAVRIAVARTTVDFEARHGRVDGELVVLALGRLGGSALTHASDLDLVFVHSGSTAVWSDGAVPHDATVYWNRFAQRVIAALSIRTAAGPLYDVDVRLRPSGEQGPLVTTIESFRRYGLDSAWTWERMAFARARPITGDDAGKAAAGAALRAILEKPGDSSDIWRDIAAMRARMDSAKPPRGPLDLKLLPGGLVDVEFLVHATQLATGRGLRPHLPDALDELIAAGCLDAELAPAFRVLSDALFVSRLTAPDGAIQSPSAGVRTARACGRPDWSSLLTDLSGARHVVAAEWRSRFGTRRVVDTVR